MPQVSIEYSSNVAAWFDAHSFARLLHSRMVALIGTDLRSCKTRFIELRDTLIGEGRGDEAMIHVDIRILSGRTDKQKTALGCAALEDARSCLRGSPGNVQLTVEISDIDARHYHKIIMADQLASASSK